MILFFLIVTATFRPPQPTVGDLITVEFQQPVVLEASPDYEVVSQNGKRVVIRTFRPKPIKLAGQIGAVKFQNLILPVKSVLKEGDDLEPAPLKPPHEIAYPRLPGTAIMIVTAIALAAWIAAWLLARRRRAAELSAVPMDPAERFRGAVAAARTWATLADATRLYLATLSPHLGVELTTTQLLGRIDAGHLTLVGTILRQGDLEKFSPWGAPSGDFKRAAEDALTLIPPPPEEIAA